VFQRLMDVVICGLSYMTCLLWLDDFIIFGRSFNEQLARLPVVFRRFRSANLKLKLSMRYLFRWSVSFLEHVVSEHGISMKSQKVRTIQNWPSCESLTELPQFLGTCCYYRRFVKDFSMIGAPLYALTKKGAKYEWTAERQRAFEAVKLRLMSEPILDVPMDTGTYTLDCDASNYGLRAVMFQEQSGIEKVIAFSSRTMNKPELRYDTTPKELLAIVNGLKQFASI